jgi:hypothetical protein
MTSRAAERRLEIPRFSLFSMKQASSVEGDGILQLSSLDAFNGKLASRGTLKAPSIDHSRDLVPPQNNPELYRCCNHAIVGRWRGRISCIAHRCFNVAGRLEKKEDRRKKE